MDKENVVQIHKEFYPDVKKNEVAKCTGKWLGLENGMASKPNKAQRKSTSFSYAGRSFCLLNVLAQEGGLWTSDFSVEADPDLLPLLEHALSWDFCTPSSCQTILGCSCLLVCFATSQRL